MRISLERGLRAAANRLPDPDLDVRERAVEAAGHGRHARRSGRFGRAVGGAVALTAAGFGLGVAFLASRADALPPPPRNPLPLETVIKSTSEQPDPFHVRARIDAAINATTEAVALPSGTKWEGPVANVDFRTHFMMVVTVRDRQSITIRTIRIQSVSSRVRQICVVVTEGSLGSAQGGGAQRLYAFHAVAIRWTRALRRSVPGQTLMTAEQVLRNQAGRLLIATRHARPRICR